MARKCYRSDLLTAMNICTTKLILLSVTGKTRPKNSFVENHIYTTRVHTRNPNFDIEVRYSSLEGKGLPIIDKIVECALNGKSIDSNQKENNYLRQFVIFL